MNPRVDEMIAGLPAWREEFERLRAILLGCGLGEELKWGQPCYVLGKANIVLIHGFRDYCALLFFKGALMKDPNGLLVRQTENVQSARQIRFAGMGEIARLAPVLAGYVREAVEVETAGLKVQFRPVSEMDMPDEFRARLASDAALRKAFAALTPGRQKAYLLHFSQAARPATREARIGRCVPLILGGKGLDDR